MKTERRHELQKNALADSLEHWILAIQPYTRTIVGLGLALVVLAFSYAFVSAKSAQRLSTGWDQFFAALNTNDRDKLHDVIKAYDGTSVGNWAKLSLADILLNEASTTLFKDKTTAREQLREAADLYNGVLSATREPTLQQRSTFGLARAHEALGELPEAVEEYQNLAKKWPEGAYADMASARAKDLDSPGTKQFYDWFAKFTPQPEAPKGPGIPGLKPDFLHESLDNPATSGQGVMLPSVLGDKALTGESKATPTTPPADVPSDGKPAAETPATPSTEPAAPAKPSAEPAPEKTPAEEKPSTPAEPPKEPKS